ncbi:MAG: alpha-glucan family phosphorylase [Candidatus Bathyarchaeota archaeon]|nr:alpha-glucan family phosphorylase [Candidatus Termiticorpusculum sp.]
MEIGVASEIPTYSGGLGVLAGDTLRSSADLKLPVVAVTLLCKKGFFRQELTSEGKQIEYNQDWVVSNFMKVLSQEVTVLIQDRIVKIQAWLYQVKSLTGGVVPVFFLDTDVEENTPEDREITSYLYGGDQKYRIKQEIVLGIGGVRMLDALGFNVRKYHINEGHASFLALELLQKHGMIPEKVRDLCVFTTHTPVESGHDKFSYDLVKDVLDGTTDMNVLKTYGGVDVLNMTLLALNLSKYVNGVAKQHQWVSKRMFIGYEIHAITNGVHSYTWTGESFQKLYDQYLPGWANEPELLARVVDGIPNQEIWSAHQKQKELMIDYANSLTKANLDYDVFTMGFARRATEYKRAYLLFSDLERLRNIGKKHKIQLIFAGKAHPRDTQGKRLIEQLFNYANQLKPDIKMVYLPNYDVDMAKKLLGGVDVWLNTPLKPLEASGTSGMKAAHNGVLNFSVLDGWWLEGWIECITGWSIGSHPDDCIENPDCITKEIADIYNKLEYVILPTYYERLDEWTRMMKNSISKIAYYFNSHRMMRRYVTEAYL